MAKIIGWHADTSACYTRGCKLMATSVTADQIEAAAFAAECVAQAGVAKLPAEPTPTYTDPDEQAWWVEIRAHHRTVTIGGREFTLAPKGKSGVTHPYGDFHLHITEAVPEISAATPAAIAAAIAGEYPRLASIWAWDEYPS